jgi:hypothetical protein
MSKVGNYQIPFDKDGNQQHFPTNWGWEGAGAARHPGGPEWRDNVPFNDTLTWGGAHRGRSAAYMTWTRESNGKSVVMFLGDLEDVVKALRDGKVTGTWRFTKRGQNYGIKLQVQSDLAA